MARKNPDVAWLIYQNLIMYFNESNLSKFVSTEAMMSKRFRCCLYYVCGEETMMVAIIEETIYVSLSRPLIIKLKDVRGRLGCLGAVQLLHYPLFSRVNVKY